MTPGICHEAGPERRAASFKWLPRADPRRSTAGSHRSGRRSTGRPVPRATRAELPGSRQRWASSSMSEGAKKLRKGVPDARAPFSAIWSPGRSPSSRSSSGNRNVMASVEPGANEAIWLNVAAFASFVRYMLTPVEATTAGSPGVEACGPQLVPPRGRPRSRPAPAEAMRGRRSRAPSDAGASRPADRDGPLRRRAGREAISGRRWANVSSPAPRSTYWSTPRTASAVTRSSMNRARATMDARNPRVKTGSMSGRSRHPSSGATNCNPTSSSSTWGDASTRTCRARHKAVRTAVLSGPVRLRLRLHVHVRHFSRPRTCRRRAGAPADRPSARGESTIRGCSPDAPTPVTPRRDRQPRGSDAAPRPGHPRRRRR